MANVKDLIDKVAGAVRSNLADIASQLTWPEITKIEAITLQAVIDANGDVVAQPEPVTVLPQRIFELNAIDGFMQAATSTAASLVRVQLEEDGRSFEMFRNPFNLAALVADGGPCKEFVWPGGMYKFRPGASVSANIIVDRNRWQQLVAAERIVGVTVRGNLLVSSQALPFNP